jgi:hypothetical protein
MRFRRRFIFAALCLLIANAPFGCGKDDDGSNPQIRHPQDFMAADVSGWEMSVGSLEAATTLDDLRDTEVDGGFYPFELHNFQEFARAVYIGRIQGAEKQLTVWITELASEGDAAAMYDDSENYIKPPSSEPLAQPVGDASRIWQNGLFTRVLGFTRDEYWVKVSIEDLSDDADQVLQLFATNIDQGITE